MSTHSFSEKKRSLRKKNSSAGGSSRRQPSNGDRTVRRLRLSKAQTVPDVTTIAEVARRMASKRTDAILLTDNSGLLCGIVTDRDLTLKGVGEGLPLDVTPISHIMTKNPIVVSIDSSAVDAMQKMVQGRFRHLPVVDSGEIVAVLDITKCLYDAIARMEKAAEKGNAMAAALEGVERQFGNNSASASFIDTFRDKMFRPTLAALIGDQTKLATVQGTDAVFIAAKKMKEFKVSSVIVTEDGSNIPRGILTSKDILMRVLAMGLSPVETTIERVMTPNPECSTLETTIVDALHIMHDGKFLHLPVIDADGKAVACIDVIQLTNGAIKTAVGNSGGATDQVDNMMQRFWDSALSLEPPEPEEDVGSVRSSDFSEVPVQPIAGTPSQKFPFKMEDRNGRVHRFTCGSDSLTELAASIAARFASDYDPKDPPAIMYVDEDGDKVVLMSDSDLSTAVQFAKTTNAKFLKLELEFSEEKKSEVSENQLKPLPSSKTATNGGDTSATQPSYLFQGYGSTILLATSVACLGVAAGILYKVSRY